MTSAGFGSRLRRARLPRVLLAYLAASWLVLQVASLLRQELQLPPWLIPVTFVLLLVGLVVLVATAWIQSHPDVSGRARRDEVPEAWEIDLGDLKESVTRGRLPHLTWARAVLGGVVALTLLFGTAAVVVLLRGRQEPPETRERVVGEKRTSDIKPIAVLPFVNLSSDKENEYFSDGITEDVMARLSRIHSLRVISRTSSMRYKGTTKSLRQVAGELGVQAVLEGSVRRVGDRVRIVAQLIDADTDEHLWADTYDREMSDIFAVQGEIANRIAAALEAKLSPAERERMGEVPTQNLTAYDLYLRGRESMHGLGREDSERAVALFNRAIEMDPNYALAYAGRAYASAWLAYLYAYPREWIDRAIEDSDRALAIDPDLAEAYFARGLVKEMKGLYGKALEDYRRSTELDPNYALGVNGVAFILLRTGKPVEALSWARKALALDPSLSDNNWLVGDCYRAMEDAVEAERWYRRALDLKPDYQPAYQALAILYLDRGEMTRAKEIAQQMLTNAPRDLEGLYVAGLVDLFAKDYRSAKSRLESYMPTTSSRLPHARLEALPHLAYVYRKLGDEGQARRLLEEAVALGQELVHQGNERGVVRFALAAAYAMRDEKREALHWLEETLKLAWPPYPGASSNPLFASLHGEQQLEDLLARYKAKADEMRVKAREID